MTLEVVMLKRIFAAIIGLTVSGASFGVSAAILPPPPTKTALLIWDYPTLTPEIVFNVYQTTNLADPSSNWKVLTNVTATSCVIQMSGDTQFYAVTASNVVTHLESPLRR